MFFFIRCTFHHEVTVVLAVTYAIFQRYIMTSLLNVIFPFRESIVCISRSRSIVISRTVIYCYGTHIAVSIKTFMAVFCTYTAYYHKVMRTWYTIVIAP